jgi:hypothetical protein
MSYISDMIAFPVNRLPPNVTTPQDLDAFIQKHGGEKHRLVVSVNPIGIGDAFADYLESAGFAVVRTNSES